MQATTGFTTDQIQQAVDAILAVLGEPETELHQEIMGAIVKKDFDMAKRLAAANLRDNFCKSLGYIGGAYKLTANTPTILAESARAAAEFSKERTLDRLGAEIERAIY